MATNPDELDPRSDPHAEDHGSDLKFVPATVDDQTGGGWYRELPDAQIEVMSRAQLERVPLENQEPEVKARSVVEKMMKRQPPGD